MIIDLIYVKDDEGSTMSCAIFGEGHDGMLGPVQSKDGVKALAAMLAALLPDHFPRLKDAEDHLLFVHFRNMTLHRNEAGQDYPWVLKRE